MNTFETSLLTERREHVATRATAQPTRSRRAKRLRWSAVPAGAAAATAVALVLVQSPAAAYAVDKTDNGNVVVTIDKLSDASGLQQALRDQGINAYVNYDANLVSEAPPPGAVTRSRPDSGTESGPNYTTNGAPGASGKSDESGGSSSGMLAVQTRCGSGPVQVQMTADAVTFTISRQNVDSNSTLYITTGGSQTELSALQIRWDC